MKQTNELITQLYRHNKKAIGFLCTSEDSEEKRKKIKTYSENYCERFDISPNIITVENSSDEKELNKACDYLIKDGANGIIVETTEVASNTLKSLKIRMPDQYGVMFATYDKIEGMQFLHDGILVVSSPDYEAMSKQVIDELSAIIAK